MPETPFPTLSRITRHVLWLIAALAFMAPSSSRAQDSDEIDSWWSRYVRNEPAALAAASAVAQRSGHLLRLKLRDRTLELESATYYCSGDGERCDDGRLRCNDVIPCSDYTFMHHERQAGAYVVLVYSYGEDRTVFWIDDTTGKVTDIKSEPHFSPDGTHFAIVQYSDFGGAYSGIQVWRTKGPFLLTEYHELNSDAVGPRIYANFIRWLDNHSFLLTVHWNNQTSGFTSSVKRGDVWAFERPPAAEAPSIICSYGRAEFNDTTGMTLLLKLDYGAVCVEDKTNTHVETEVKHCVFSASASPCENIEIPRVR